MSAEELIFEERRKELDARWKSDVDKKLDMLVAFADRYGHYLESLTAREKRRQEFWEKMEDHVARWGAISILTGGMYALWLGAKELVKANL